MNTYTVTYSRPSRFPLTHTIVSSSSPVKAARAAIKYWQRNKIISRQPRTTHSGGWEGITVESDSINQRSLADALKNISP